MILTMLWLPQYLSCLFIPKPGITLRHDINCDVEKHFVIQDHICDLGQNDIIVTELVRLSHTLARILEMSAF